MKQTMVHIKETFPAESVVAIEVDGQLNENGLPSLIKVCQRHLNKNKKVILVLSGLIRADRAGKDFLKQVGRQIELRDLPEFLQLELCRNENS